MTSELKWEEVASSHIDAFAYIPGQAEILIRYKDQTIYSFPCGEEEAAGMRTAQSVGRYVRLMFGNTGRKLS